MQLVHQHTGEIKNISTAELKRAKRLGVRAKVLSEAQRVKLNCFLTLTLNPDKIAFGVCPICFLRIVWDRFLKRLNRTAGRSISFISIVEKSENSFHLHTMLNANIRLAWIRQAWTECGGGYIISQRIIALHDEVRNVAAYITKDYVDSKLTGRLITTSRDIDLTPTKGDKSNWEVLPTEQILDTELSWRDENNDIDAPAFALCAHGYFVDYLLSYIKTTFPKQEPHVSAAVSATPPPALEQFIINNHHSGQT